MKKLSVIGSILLGIFTGVPVIVLSFFGYRLASLPFLPFEVFDFTSRLLPGRLISFGIDSIVSLIISLKIGHLSQSAKTAEHIIAILFLLVIAGIMGLILGLLSRKVSPDRMPVLSMGFGILSAAMLFFIELGLGYSGWQLIGRSAWLAFLVISWGYGLGWVLRETAPEEKGPVSVAESRRRFIFMSGSAAVALVFGLLGLGYYWRRRSTMMPEAIPAATPRPAETSGPAASPPEDVLAKRIPPAPGTRPEITSNADFYRVDIDSSPPQINPDEWRLEVTGKVDNPLSLTLDDIRSRKTISQYVTQSCISNPVGGSLISTALYTGVPLRDIMKEAGMQPQTQQVQIQSADGFYESVTMEDLQDERTLLVFEMNGQPLPADHGFPLRISIPNRYGMKQPKWILSLEAIDHEGTGYWVDRDWSKQARPKTTSVIDNVTVQRNGMAVALSGGIAWAGDRGISKVEVRIDDEQWREAELRDPALSPLTWVQWRFERMVQPGKHIAAVRAYDGSGQLQVMTEQGSFPDGATGVSTFKFEV